MNVVFLDIAGVMRTFKDDAVDSYGQPALNPKCVRHLKRILDETHSNIVLTSSWRKGFRGIVGARQHIFNQYDLGRYLVGMTPVLRDALRGEEIQEYINAVKNNDRLKVDRFVILDDDSDMGDLSPFLVQTSCNTGLTQADTDEAIQTLTKEA